MRTARTTREILDRESARASRATLAAIARTRKTAGRACDLDRWMRHRPGLTTGVLVAGGALAIVGVIRAVRSEPCRGCEAGRRRGPVRRLGGVIKRLLVTIVRGAIVNNIATGLAEESLGPTTDL